MAINNSNTTAWLLLQDGTLLKGKSFGVKGTSGGELCFNTGMTGYQEVFTDPSYTGQVLIMNNAYIGNYGVKTEDVESDSVKINALVCKNISERYSRMTANNNIENYLIENNIVAIHDIDTRFLVRHIRSKGAMNAIVSTEYDDIKDLQAELVKVPDMAGLELSSKVSTKETYFLGNSNSRIRIAVIDYGIKKNILKCLLDRGAYLKVFPAKCDLVELIDFKPKGFFLSNGPGDPAAMGYAENMVRLLLQTNKPLFGICLGHQLLARACGIPTYKMHYGHRGLNHPVLNVLNGKSEITTQNHGFAIDADAVSKNEKIEITHINLNDGSIEGIRLKYLQASSVQFHPEATPGTHDSRYLFDNFFDQLHNSYR